MEIKISGLDKLEKDLKEIQKKARNLQGEHQVSFGELFTDAFMKKYSNFLSFEEFLQSSGFKVETAEDFEAIPDDEFDKYVKENTKFTCWQDMLHKATSEYALTQLGL